MYQSNDPATLKVRRALSGAMFKLLERVPYDDITVTRLSDVAGVVKRRFFQIFQSKEEVLDCCMDDLFEEYSARRGLVVAHVLSDVADVLIDFFKEYRHEMRLLVRNDKAFVIKRRCCAFLLDDRRVRLELDALSNDDDARDMVTFVVGGVTDLLETALVADEFSDERADGFVELVKRLVC
jgi:AcrR family transcriptional regulator